MKILGGQWKGRNFYMPAEIRPTQNVVRKALFDLIGHDLTGLTFVDLFAGSGAMGLEALSLGALKVLFIEKNPQCIKVIEENILLLNENRAIKYPPPLTPPTPFGRGGEKFQKAPPLVGGVGEGECQVLEADAFAMVKELASHGQKFDIVFVDPPYERGMAKKMLKTLGAYDIVAANSVVVIQHDRREILPEPNGSLILFKQRQYGNSYLSLYKVLPHKS